MLVDDEADIHAALRLSLQDAVVEGRSLQLIDAHSTEDARMMLAQHPDIALVLLDVVMETEHAGLELVRFIRQDQANRAIQIVLVTGQPGYAPQREVVTKYKIDGYRLKSELTADKIFVSVYAALRTHQVMRETERQRLQLVAQTQTLLRANADLMRFAEISAHHLMEPTRRLTSYAQRLRNRLAELQTSNPDEEVRTSLETLEHDAAHLRALVRDIQLYLAAAEPRGPLRVEDVDAVLQSVRQRFSKQIAALGAELEIQPLPPANLDRPRLADLFALLLDNALRHGRPTDARVVLRISIEGERDGGMSRYCVSDNGPGIASEYQQRAFEIFERLHQENGRADPDIGTGIGLSIARRIVESRHGRIWIKSVQHGGAMVVFELPDGDGK
ncbi:MAG: ATP-binding protein [Proteobacteria bacterium]|nr:ATP-binding protein [Pseudomonadota bacterium]